MRGSKGTELIAGSWYAWLDIVVSGPLSILKAAVRW